MCTAMGSQKWLSLHGHDTPEDAVAKLKGDGYQVNEPNWPFCESKPQRACSLVLLAWQPIACGSSVPKVLASRALCHVAKCSPYVLLVCG